jgi:hypothetical protein
MLRPDLLAILCCPKCHGPLRELSSPEGLLCDACALLYPILDGIPNFLIEEARPCRPELPR